MMGFQPVVLWTDLLLFGLLGCILLAAWSARRSEPMRAAWGRVGASGVGMTSLTLLLIFVLVGLVDSLHYRERLAPAGVAAAETKPQLSTDVRSALDALAEPLRTRVEKTYSAPLATHAFSKETIERDGALHLSGFVGRASDGTSVRAEAVGDPQHVDALGIEVAERLLRAGAGELLGG